MAGLGNMKNKTLWCKKCKKEFPSDNFKMKVGYRKVCYACFVAIVKEAQHKRYV
jgi:hypothetical protein